MNLDLLVDLFRKDSIKVKFENRKQAGKGLMLILKKYGSISGYDDRIYGLRSEEQLKLLDEHGVKYERVENDT